MSSHREAPEISKDPVADSTDLYAFVSPDQPDTVTLIANYIPLEAPGGGPNFYEFGHEVLYTINIDNDGDGEAEIVYQFRFTTVNNNPESFLYNDGPITSLTPPSPSSNWNRQQTYSLTRIDQGSGTTTSTLLGDGLLCPPCNIGPLSTPDYSSLASAAIHSFSAGGYTGQVFVGQRAEGFYVDLGAVFDLGDLRPFAGLHAGGPAAGLMNGMPGVNSSAAVNVHSLALQVPMDQLTSGTPTGPTDPKAVIGVWTAAYRQRACIRGAEDSVMSGPWTQVSRLGNPLVNELIIGIGDKNVWNHRPPLSDGKEFLHYFARPLLADLLPVLYVLPNHPHRSVFPNLAAYNRGKPNTRPDLEAILLTGIPAGVISIAPPFYTTYGGTGVKADMLRLNTAIAPTGTSGNPGTPSNLGLLGLDIAGFPNGRRVFDDVATIELRAVAGATLPFVVSGFTADAAAGAVDFGLTSSPTDQTAMGTENYLTSFPYLGTPYSGFLNPETTPVSH
jgi:hypothetical protein